MKPQTPAVATHLLFLCLACGLACQGPRGLNELDPVSGPSELQLQRAAGPLRPDAARLLADVAWLADDAREGRRAGTSGERAAAQFLAARLQALGLEPAGEQGWFQTFEVELPARDGGQSHLAWKTARGRGSAQGAAFLTPLFCSSTGEVSGEVVFTGYGISDEDRAWDDFAGLELAGKIALIVRGTPPAPTSAVGDEQDSAASLRARNASWGTGGGIFHKVMAAKRRGAIAVILAQDPERAAQPPLAFDPGRTAQAGIPVVMLEDQLAQQLYDSAWLAAPAGAQGRRTLAAATLSADIVRERALACNVLARLAGADATRTVVIGAHYDHLGRGGAGSLASESLGEIHNGADDNASGAAVVLEVARCLVAAPAPAGDVIFALWSGEELGLLGSEHWAEHPTIDLDEVLANLNLDMVGRAGSGSLQVLGAGTAAAFAPWLAEADARSELDLIVSTSTQGLSGSDHQTFLEREIPALHFFSGVHIDYHKPTDDTALFESEGAAKVAALAIDLITRMQSVGELAYVQPEAGEENLELKASFAVRFGSMPAYGYEGEGLLLDGVGPGSPAEAAGLLAGDVLVGLGEAEVTSIADFMGILQSHKPGDVLRATYLRQGQRETVLVTLQARAVK